MISWPLKSRTTPIGVDIGARSVKLVQLSTDHKQLVEAVRWDLPPTAKTSKSELPVEALADALKQARRHRKFRGRDAVLCLGRNELFIQNIRVAKTSDTELTRLIQQEAAGRVPYSVTETEIRYLEAAEVRHGDSTLREVILCACHRPMLEQLLSAAEQADLHPVAVDIESNALVRSYLRQYRRDEDRQQRSMLVHVGHSGTAVVITEGDHTLFAKYVEVGGRDLDDAVARKLQMPLSDATALRRNNGDRRADQQDAEVSQSIAEATRPVVDKLVSELSLCVRYHSVTFRGKPLVRMVLGGGEASESLREVLNKRLDLPCDLFAPLRDFANQPRGTRDGQWDVATGLAMRTVEATQ